MTDKTPTETTVLALSEGDLEEIRGGIDTPTAKPLPAAHAPRPRTSTAAGLLSMDEGCAM